MTSDIPPDLARYSRQILFHGLGLEGQKKLRNARILICGVGALGTHLAETLVRAGVGFVRLVDRDFVEITNLQRQVLFDEEDLRSQLPKAVAAANKLARINSAVRIEPVVADVSSENILGLAQNVDLILDGTDNFETRFLLNDLALELRLPWVYAGCIGSHGQTMPILPGQSACLRCLIESPPPPGSTETCDTAGVLGPAINVIASWQSVSAIKILTGNLTPEDCRLTLIDVWQGSLRHIQTAHLPEQTNCPACRRGERLYLHAPRQAGSTTLCGRNAVQLVPHAPLSISLTELASRLRPTGHVDQNPFLIKFQPASFAQVFTIFPDGRAIISGTDDPTLARTLYNRFIGS